MKRGNVTLSAVGLVLALSVPDDRYFLSVLGDIGRRDEQRKARNRCFHARTPTMSHGRPRPFKHLPIAISAVSILLMGCLPAERDVRAYHACMSRHQQDAALCEGPRQAYEIDTSMSRSAASALTQEPPREPFGRN